MIRVSGEFMMVAVCSDASPSTAAAPQPSWCRGCSTRTRRRTARQSGSNDASSGRRRAPAFSRKTTPMATPMSSRTFITEDTAAMALPPQMDVPKVPASASPPRPKPEQKTERDDHRKADRGLQNPGRRRRSPVGCSGEPEEDDGAVQRKFASSPVREARSRGGLLTAAPRRSAPTA